MVLWVYYVGVIGCKGGAMTISWECYRGVTGVLCGCCGSIMVMLWECNGCIIGVLREHGWGIMMVLWRYYWAAMGC